MKIELKQRKNLTQQGLNQVENLLNEFEKLVNELEFTTDLTVYNAEKVSCSGVFVYHNGYNNTRIFFDEIEIYINKGELKIALLNNSETEKNIYFGELNLKTINNIKKFDREDDWNTHIKSFNFASFIKCFDKLIDNTNTKIEHLDSKLEKDLKELEKISITLLN